MKKVLLSENIYAFLAAQVLAFISTNENRNKEMNEIMVEIMNELKQADPQLWSEAIDDHIRDMPRTKIIIEKQIQEFLKRERAKK